MAKHSLENKITYSESPVYAIANKLKQEGYEIADFHGTKDDNPISENGIGILQRRKPIQKTNFLGIKYNEEQERALYIGHLILKNPKMNAKENKRWILEVYGRENVSPLIETMKKISEPYNVKVNIKLESESPYNETIQEDSWFAELKDKFNEKFK